MAHTRRARAETVCEAQYDEFPTFFKYDRAEARFPRAQPRARPSSARQSILLITEMIFDYLIVTVSLKATAIGMSEVAKKVHTSTPPNDPVNGR